MKDFVFLSGPPGVGKSAVGKLLAVELNLHFIDLDIEIVSRAQKPIPEIFSDEGEDGFRALEQITLNDILDGQPGVIALGGGALLDPQNREVVEDCGQVVCLDGSVTVLSERLNKSDAVRPLISEDMTTKLKSLLSQRAEHYASFSLRCSTNNLTPEEVVWEVQKIIGRFYIRGMGDGYQVRVMNGGLDRLGQTLETIGHKGSVCLVTDKNVGPLYAQKTMISLENANFKTHLHSIPTGESHKNLETVSEIWNAFLEAKLDRGSIAIALGGGVVGDLTGFAVATYMRGIDWVNVPTTLLAMVDASIGGKTGFDLPRGKNLVGAFHPPRYVLVDPEVLSTLPETELRCGMAEAVKHGVIGSPELFEQCLRGWPDSPEEREQLVKEAMSVKVGMIQNDPYEKGFRAALNLGHTVGHAVELLSGFEIPHGDAVSIGMVTEARLAGSIGLASNGFVETLTKTLSQLGLPIEIPKEMNRSKIIETMQLDKKVANGQIRFALPESVGQVRVGVFVDDLDKIFAQL